MCQDQNLPEVRLPPIQQSLWECGKEVNTCTNRNTTEGTLKTRCNARDLRRSSVRSIYLLTGLLTGPRGAQPVNYQAPLAALTGILKTSLLTVNPGLGSRKCEAQGSQGSDACVCRVSMSGTSPRIMLKLYPRPCVGVSGCLLP